MTQKRKNPEQFIAASPVSKELLTGVYAKKLASGALRIVEVNGQKVNHKKLGNDEVRIAEVLNQKTLFGITAENPDFIKADIEDRIAGPAKNPDCFDDQRDSLSIWADYFREDDRGKSYPDWFKVYVWQSLANMGDYDKIDREFFKRSGSTEAMYPELNREALARVYQQIDDNALANKAIDSRDVQYLVDNGSFARIYAGAVEELMPTNTELKHITDGEWKKYEMITDFDLTAGAAQTNQADELVESLQGYMTGWCIRGKSEAATYLSEGDFYVYYSQDKTGACSVPRLAISMDQGRADAGVKGVDFLQAVEPQMLDIAAKKIASLPGGEYYADKYKTEARIFDIYQTVEAGQTVTPEDMQFLSKLHTGKPLRVKYLMLWTELVDRVGWGDE